MKSILIANRGEIACRVIATARTMGLRTIAVYSEADADALHVRLADEAYPIGGSAATESYLKGDVILEVAKKSGAHSIHPGYGFLSENAGFAEACEEAGVIFIGPKSDSIRAMGLKDAAKVLMEEAGVPVVPGYHGDIQSAEHLAAEAEKVGYPVLIKAVAGGGGKGMRLVEEAKGFEKALASAQREAASAFSDDRVLIERFVTAPRHIEIQVFGDGQGEAVYLFERDCSLQRRHQKVVEEAPAPGMTEEMRSAMGDAAVAAAKAINYRGAGTVEFIVDGSDGLHPDRFFFMEMNTRLQVEHPVTEMITGEDLVEWQIRVARGEGLPKNQEALSISGHAVEARIYAEDPSKKFFPSTGTLARLQFPEESATVRVDSGVVEGQEVSMFYDPMIAKLIVWGENRADALAGLRDALEETQIAGLRHNVGFLAAIAGHEVFGAADIDTGFIERFLSELVPSSDALPSAVLACAGAYEAGARIIASDDASPWSDAGSWVLGGQRAERFTLCYGEAELQMSSVGCTPDLEITCGDDFLELHDVTISEREISVLLEGEQVHMGCVERVAGFALMHLGMTYEFVRPDPLDVDLDEGASGSKAVAPMPGKVIQVVVAAGDRVRKGDALVVVEAMKMEQTVQAPQDGKVEEVTVSVGEQVEGGAVLVLFEEEA
ncbi:MAG: acetyl/propionyl/methylcrotonyl-CoA carboxylase subunit alpha [Parvibaculaceae bacterium]|nr:acetyl/propionyl/methylcrotonyl-CoA carboxylase subunit alpha [Parvibaculaceae bacterium]